MGVAAFALGGLGLILAIVCGMLAIGQISDLRDISTPLTTGGIRAAMDTTVFLMRLVVVVILVGAVLAALSWTTRRS